jgi:hypothetical protein
MFARARARPGAIVRILVHKKVLTEFKIIVIIRYQKKGVMERSNTMEFIIEHRRTHKIIYRSYSFYNTYMKYSNLNSKHYRIVKVYIRKEN